MEVLPASTVSSADIQRAAAELHASLGPLVRRLRSVHQTGDLTFSQASVLVRLEQEGPGSQGALAGLENITPQSMGAILSAMEERGLISRRADPGDGRRVVVSITPAGRRSLQGVRQEKARRLARAIANGFSPDEQRQLIEAMPLIERLSRLV